MEQAVPRSTELPDDVRRELSAAGYGHEWFDAEGDRIRLTVLNLYVKLRGLDLWRFVGWRDSTSPGCLEFTACDGARLEQECQQRWDFRSRRASTGHWDAMEKRVRGALHVKHFRDWPPARVQAHIDAAGLWLRHPVFWWVGLPVTGPLHLAAYGSYRDVFRLRALLLRQGGDPRVLVGREA
jgi:hypothetical protein